MTSYSFPDPALNGDIIYTIPFTFWVLLSILIIATLINLCSLIDSLTSLAPVYRTIANSTIIIATFAACIGFAYFVWVGIQTVSDGLASLNWEAFRDAIEDLKEVDTVLDDYEGVEG